MVCGSAAGYATVDRRVPEFTERMAWMSAKHPRTFSGRSRRSSRRLTRVSPADFTFLVPPLWCSTIESSRFFAFCSLDIF
jgi:hypothetical protein